jgi:hypothetical protein
MAPRFSVGRQADPQMPESGRNNAYMDRILLNVMERK